jgi:hypothetical protein
MADASNCEHTNNVIQHLLSSLTELKAIRGQVIFRGSHYPKY